MPLSCIVVRVDILFEGRLPACRYCLSVSKPTSVKYRKYTQATKGEAANVGIVKKLPLSSLACLTGGGIGSGPRKDPRIKRPEVLQGETDGTRFPTGRIVHHATVENLNADAETATRARICYPRRRSLLRALWSYPVSPRDMPIRKLISIQADVFRQVLYSTTASGAGHCWT